GVEAHSVDTHVHPEVEGIEERLFDLRVVEVEVWLMGVEPVQVISVGDIVQGPVRSLEVLEDDSRVLVLLVRLAPYVEVALRAARPRAPRALEPRVLVRCVVAHELVDDADASAVRLPDELID